MKHILLIVPRFFSYEKYIKNELENMGFKVNMVYENVNEFSYLSKILIKIIGDKKKYFDRYYSRKTKGNKFDYVLVIRGSFLSVEALRNLKQASPKAKFYMYQWDSASNNPNAKEISPYFDKISTFDIDDSKKFGWFYRPLFYLKSSNRSTKREYDISFIGTLHSQRVKIFQKIKKIEAKKYLFIYSKASHFIKEKYINHNSDFRGVSYKDLSFKSLPLEETNKILSKSHMVIDYTHPAQTGFTMRTCEAIGHKCKLVTNNARVIDADFYDKNNVYVYNIEDFQIPKSFIDSPYHEIPQEILQNYSITNWLKDVINYEQIN